MSQTIILIGKKAEQQIAKVPGYIRDKLYQWVERVEEYGKSMRPARLKVIMTNPLQGKD